MTHKSITPEEAKRLVDQGAKIIDIRGHDEFLREHIPGAENHPLDTLPTVDGDADMVIFHCKSGNRTSTNADKLMSAARCDARILEGGIEAWRKAGHPVVSDRSQPIEIQRQVQIAAGSLAFVGTLLSQVVAPEFIAIPAIVGAGLIFAGVTGWCGMAHLLSAMPWNRRTHQKSEFAVPH